MFRASSSSRKHWFAIPKPMLAGFIAAAAASLVISLVNVRSSEVRKLAVASIDRMTNAMRQLSSFTASLKDAETGQRGFLLTGDEAYLDLRSRDNVERQLQALADSNADNSSRQLLVKQIDALAHQKLRELQETIDLVRNGDREGAIALVRTDRGKDVMDRLNDLVDSLTQHQSQELQQRRRAWDEAAITSTYYSWGGSLLLLALVLISAVLTMREYRNKARQTWVAAGLSGLGQTMQGDYRIEEIAKRALEYLAAYMGARVGTSYALDDVYSGLRLVGSYAISGESIEARLQIGEGLAGEAARSGEIVKVDGLSQDKLIIKSSTVTTQPLELLIAPAIENGQVYALFELGFLHRTGDVEIDLLKGASSMLAVAVRSAIDRSRLESLLEETRRQSEELLEQQEEMRASNEELEQQSDALLKSQAHMELQQRELEQSNAHLEEQTHKLEHQREQLLRVQEALTDKARELELASQYKSEFLANMSHELRTPLNSTLILAKLLSENKTGNLSNEQIKYAETIHSAGRDLLILINDILDLAKIEAGQMTVNLEAVNIASAVQSLVEPLRPLAQNKGLSLSWSVASDLPSHVQTDVVRVGQILRNLLSNAIKFTDSGGVDLQVTSSELGVLEFSVKDTGIGIADHQQEIIFDAFQQADGSTHRKHGGTGLGLAISRDLAKLLGGNITVESVVGKGSTFILSMPLERSVTQPLLGLVQSQSSPVPSKSVPSLDLFESAVESRSYALPLKTGTSFQNERHILIIEDDDRFASIILEIADEMGFSCEVATTASDGLTAAMERSPKAIVLDINLPDFSGLGVLDQLKRNPCTRHIPVHIMSVADYSKEALGRGAVGYALKPVKQEELVRALRRLEAKFTQKLHRVLVVEDDERQRVSVHSLLSSSEVEVVCAGCASEALKHLEKGTFDCMVMDLNLPDMNGYDLLQGMSEKENISFPPVIVYTGKALSRDDEAKLRRLSNSIIIKDARSPERLLDEVTLFLHQVESKLSPERRQMLQKARSRDELLEGRTVLLVEDDVRNIFALSSILEPTGIEIEIARNGVEALELLDRENIHIDLVLMDIMMPEMDGYTTMQKIRNRKKWRRLPIIALTAKAMKDDQEKCLAAGANDYIAKPLDIEKLLSLVRVWMPR